MFRSLKWNAGIFSARFFHHLECSILQTLTTKQDGWLTSFSFFFFQMYTKLYQVHASFCGTRKFQMIDETAVVILCFSVYFIEMTINNNVTYIQCSCFLCKFKLSIRTINLKYNIRITTKPCFFWLGLRVAVNVLCHTPLLVHFILICYYSSSFKNKSSYGNLRKIGSAIAL